MKEAVLILVVATVFQSGSRIPASADAADAAERLSGRRAHMGAQIRLLAGHRLAGPAITMRAVRDDGASSTGEGLKAIRVLENAAPGSVIVLVLDGEKDFAVFGATFATLAKSRNLAGFVVDGGMRGVEAFRSLGVPLFARGTVAGSAGGHYRLVSIGEPIVCGDLQVAEGDVIVADEDGVAVVPKDVDQEVFALAARLRRDKEELLPLIRKLGSYTKAAAEQAKKRKPGRD
jgi:4-hydroxy-4-methyl-2-oxoglutarate aldolase